MLIHSSLHELKKRENALKIINKKIHSQGRDKLYDLTGLSGGFLLKKDDLKLLETYVGPALFEDMLEKWGKEHLGGEKVLGFNRTSAGILATILALVKPKTYVIHYLPELPSHPSIPRSAKLVGAEYLEFDNLDEFFIPENTSLIVITGSTMDHKVIAVEEFQDIIKKADGKVPVMVDDASGARLRTVIFNQPSAIDLGADLVVTSTDKLMDGPRGGLMAGKSELMDQIKSKAHQFGLEAQTPVIAGIVRALENFNPEILLKSFENKNRLLDSLNYNFKGFEQTPTGVMITPQSLEREIESRGIGTSLSDSDLSFLWAIMLLKEKGILTIPAVGMPGASPTIRIDLASKDAKLLPIENITEMVTDSFNDLISVLSKPNSSEKEIIEECSHIIFN
ncbi:TIGR03576 family pyridoxal phosphate-dependent enzyme [Methanobacterium alcaliphilum]|uniref:TIGR03576 family pyridoxal phosphate-dependent enzyme n=1 Tax=Methanobacterium alcaliphilum TaxID=392018 RepID=UPI00200A2B3E|nr:TIGR03576 family pyridoxal phosphate-dependent enzyme [Methanobacterium alcaliphilum]